MWRLHCLAAAIVVLVVAGCGGDGLRRAPVQGKVTAKGVPVGGATVSFVPAGETKGEGGIGTANADGNFTLTGSRQGDSGVVPGKYKVVVSRFMDRDGTILSPETFTEAEYPFAIDSVPAPYSSLDSPLEVTVAEAGGAVNVEIPVATLEKK